MSPPTNTCTAPAVGLSTTIRRLALPKFPPPLLPAAWCPPQPSATVTIVKVAASKLHLVRVAIIPSVLFPIPTGSYCITYLGTISSFRFANGTSVGFYRSPDHQIARDHPIPRTPALLSGSPDRAQRLRLRVRRRFSLPPCRLRQAPGTNSLPDHAGGYTDRGSGPAESADRPACRAPRSCPPPPPESGPPGGWLRARARAPTRCAPSSGI